jgi:hypothetical protein
MARIIGKSLDKNPTRIRRIKKRIGAVDNYASRNGLKNENSKGLW